MPESTVIDAVQKLKAHLATIGDLHSAAAVLRWDQETLMPPRGAKGRADQLATLTRVAHDLFVSPTTEALVTAAEVAASHLDPDSDDAALARVTRRDHTRETKLPSEFVAERARARSLSVQVWREARRQNDFAAFQPSLDQMIDFARRTADYLGYDEHPYDALLDLYEPDLTCGETARVFARLREVTVPLVRAIAARGQVVDAGFLTQEFEETKQRQFALGVAEAFGYDLTRGRLDESAHPFETAFHRDDVRITTRYDRRFLPAGIFGIFHEAGHALYEQGTAPSLARTPLARGASHGMHESQSRMWENLVGRSRAFWQYAYPRLLDTFPAQLRSVDLETFYRAVNRVSPSLIRVEADEVTYNLHTLLRFELEKSLIEGELKVKDLPEAWKAKMQTYLGLTPPTDADGVMQDIHWAGGSLGYFPSYTLGNILSVQLFAAAQRAHPDLADLFRRGQFGTLLGWLREHVHRHGRKFLPKEILVRVTGSPLTPEPYLTYLQTKFGEIYGIAPAKN